MFVVSFSEVVRVFGCAHGRGFRVCMEGQGRTGKDREGRGYSQAVESTNERERISLHHTKYVKQL